MDFLTYASVALHQGTNIVYIYIFIYLFIYKYTYTHIYVCVFFLGGYIIFLLATRCQIVVILLFMVRLCCHFHDCWTVCERGKCQGLQRICCSIVFRFKVFVIACVQILLHCLNRSLFNLKSVCWPSDVPALNTPLYRLPKHICTLIYKTKRRSILTPFTTRTLSSTGETSFFVEKAKRLFSSCSGSSLLQSHRHPATSRIRQMDQHGLKKMLLRLGICVKKRPIQNC